MICGGPGQQAVSSVDLEQYCKREFRADAFPTTRLTDNAPMCSVRTDGGLGLRHHMVDLSAVCGTGSMGRLSAKTTVTCTPSRGTGTASIEMGGTGAGDKDPGEDHAGEDTSNGGNGVDGGMQKGAISGSVNGRWRIKKGFFPEMVLELVSNGNSIAGHVVELSENPNDLLLEL